MFSHIKYLRIKFNLVCTKDIKFNKFEGSMFRGGFGYIFKDIVCSNKSDDCVICSDVTNCPYAKLFRGIIKEDEKFKSATINMPVPFVISMPFQGKDEIKINETFSLEVNLIGKAIDYLQYFIYCFDNLGKRGVGKSKGKYGMISVECKDSRDIIYIDNLLIEENIKVMNFDDDYKGKSKAIINFITPVRIIEKGHFRRDIDFEVILKNILRRIELISYFHCDKKLEIDYDNLLDEVRNIEIEDRNLTLFNWSRFASNKNNVNMSGYRGYMKGIGVFKSIIPYFNMGEIVYVGKGCSFGMGKYKINFI
ncbi:MAG: CRISPR system precrRNA processing endoribonuclease RAMP protein Cas6 [Clostridiales bacterium]